MRIIATQDFCGNSLSLLLPFPNMVAIAPHYCNQIYVVAKIFVAKARKSSSVGTPTFSYTALFSDFQMNYCLPNQSFVLLIFRCIGCVGFGPWCQPPPPCLWPTNDDYCMNDICEHLCALHDHKTMPTAKKGGLLWMCCCPPPR